MIHKKLIIGVIIITSTLISCRNDEIETLDIEKIDFKINKIEVTPNLRINKTLDCWKLYYEDKEAVKIAREELSLLMNRNHYSTEREIKDNIQIKSDTVEILKYNFEELKTTYSQVGILLKNQNTIDTILSIDLNCTFGKVNYKKNTTWILSKTDYTLKFRENLEVYDLINIDYYLNKNMDLNEIENKIAISLKVKKLKMGRHYGKSSFGLMGEYQIENDEIKGDFFRLIGDAEFVKKTFIDTYSKEGEIIEFYTGDLFEESENLSVH